ncbi:MAG: type VI secretion system lipoprotein TssJ [Burkholderiaceae bacterium]|nr:type VI secretion system lipoprotein TssJ [Burkholderiaceae bacterium]MBP7660715.1 type VI secretion system lipoprotein TssJ [Burkholderiaceae bacterium]
MQASSQLNLDSRDRNAPLVVRIYTLKGPIGFQQADFFSLFERDQTLLASDLLSKEELQLQPGESRRFLLEIRAEARVVGVIGAFRDLERASWRAVYTIPDASDPASRLLGRPARLPVRVSLGAREVRVSAQ